MKNLYNIVNMKKVAIVLFLFAYLLLNFANFAGLSVCIAKDHIGLHLFGFDNSCIEIVNNCQNSNEKLTNISHHHDECEDKSLSTNTKEILPSIDLLNDFEIISNSEVSFIFDLLPSNFAHNINLLNSKNISYNLMLLAYKTVRFLI